jgi:hypothetical protein
LFRNSQREPYFARGSHAKSADPRRLTRGWPAPHAYHRPQGSPNHHLGTRTDGGEVANPAARAALTYSACFDSLPIGPFGRDETSSLYPPLPSSSAKARVIREVRVLEDEYLQTLSARCLLKERIEVLLEARNIWRGRGNLLLRSVGSGWVVRAAQLIEQ